jgi:antibiotic biosynthesis monooxygenase (ABM) superfamily enzyme
VSAAAVGGGPVTVTVARRVAPGRESEFEEWSAELTRRAGRFPGFLGAGLLRPSHVGEPWHVVYRFDSDAHLHAWEASVLRAEHLAAGEDLVHATSTHRVTGLETWFALPGRTAPAPPRWKMFVVSLAATYALQVVLNLAVGGFGWVMPLRVAVIATAVTFLMTWMVMPWAARLLQEWLYAPRRHH